MMRIPNNETFETTNYVTLVKETTVTNTKREVPSVQNIPVVSEFEDAFPEDLPGLPPGREIELLQN